jgi:RpiB/LacA/LacB family sugar-phosphate isomerase
MQVVLGSDHAGFELKKILSDHLQQNGHLVLDVGTYGPEPVDYPDYAEAVGLTVLRGEAERGILICGSGVGASVAANKIAGIRAGICHDCYSAHQGVEHDDINVLVLGARIIGSELAKDLSITFLNARFTAEERHQRRLKKILEIEKRDALGEFAKEKSL